MIPDEVETIEGGFYINCGALEFKKLHTESLTTKTDEIIKMPNRPKKPVISSSSEESSSSGDEDDDDDEDDDSEVRIFLNLLKQTQLIGSLGVILLPGIIKCIRFLHFRRAMMMILAKKRILQRQQNQNPAHQRRPRIKSLNRL